MGSPLGGGGVPDESGDVSGTQPRSGAPRIRGRRGHLGLTPRWGPWGGSRAAAGRSVPLEPRKHRKGRAGLAARPLATGPPQRPAWQWGVGSFWSGRVQTFFGAVLGSAPFWSEPVGVLSASIPVMGSLWGVHNSAAPVPPTLPTLCPQPACSVSTSSPWCTCCTSCCCRGSRDRLTSQVRALHLRLGDHQWGLGLFLGDARCPSCRYLLLLCGFPRVGRLHVAASFG